MINDGPCKKPTCPRYAHNGGYCKVHYDLMMDAAGVPRGVVPAAPVAEHIQALVRAGVPMRELGKLVGLEQNSLWRIGRQRVMLARNAAKILAVSVPLNSYEFVAPRTLVPAVGTARRLRALQAYGYTSKWLDEEFGIERRSVSAICTDSQEYVTARTAKLVAQVFDKLQLTPGPNEVTRRRSLSKGWLPPLAWYGEDIDDGEANVFPALYWGVFGEQKKVRITDEFRELRSLGVSEEAAVRRLKLTRSTLDHIKRRKAS